MNKDIKKNAGKQRNMGKRAKKLVLRQNKIVAGKGGL